MRTLIAAAVAATAVSATAMLDLRTASAAELIMPPAVTDAQVEMRFRRLDKDKDAGLARSEVRAYPALASNFSALDQDGSGTLSVAEFSGVLAMPARLGEVFSF